jgi:hypothetical protein
VHLLNLAEHQGVEAASQSRAAEVAVLARHGVLWQG